MTRTGTTYRHRLSPKQVWSGLRADARVNIWEGAVRSGKTVGSWFPWIRHVEEAPPGVLFMIGTTLDALERNVLAPLQEMIGEAAFDYSKSAGWATIGGRDISLVSAYDERSYKRIRGSTCAGWYGDELVLWPENFFRELLHRMSPPGSKGFGTTNPDSPHHWLKKGFLDRSRALGWRRFKFRLDDNPFLTDEYKEALKRENVGLWYQRFILGLWVLAAGVVYDMWDEDRHLRSDCPASHPVYGAAVDYGTSGVTTFGLFGHGLLDRRVWLRKLYYYDARVKGRSKTDRALAEDFRAFTAGVKLSHVVVDPSAASFIAELEAMGYEVTPADNRVLHGIRHMASMLEQERFLVAKGPTVQPFVDEIGGYVWDEKAQKRGEDAPVKANDHALDMTRYYLLTVFPNGTDPEQSYRIVT